MLINNNDSIQDHFFTQLDVSIYCYLTLTIKFTTVKLFYFTHWWDPIGYYHLRRTLHSSNLWTGALPSDTFGHTRTFFMGDLLLGKRQSVYSPAPAERARRVESRWMLFQGHLVHRSFISLIELDQRWPILIFEWLIDLLILATSQPQVILRIHSFYYFIIILYCIIILFYYHFII